jgi:arylsulfatase A-like enzyme
LIGHLAAKGVRSTLLVEQSIEGETQVAPPFDEVVNVQGVDGLDSEPREMPFPLAVERAINWLDQAPVESPTLLWIKSRGVSVPWLPPRGFAELYLDEFGLEGVEPGPEDPATESVDPESPADVPATEPWFEDDDYADDEVTTLERPGSAEMCYARALYAGYVTFLDVWLGRLLEAIDRHEALHETLVIVTAGAGQPLGERGELADVTPLARGECLHTLLAIRLPDREHAASRRTGLVQTVDLSPTLVEWLTSAEPDLPLALPAGRSLFRLIRGECDSLRDAALVGNGLAEWGIETADFFYTVARNQAGETESALFERPADRWDQADVLSQHPDAASRLHETLLDSTRRLVEQA